MLASVRNIHSESSESFRLSVTFRILQLHSGVENTHMMYFMYDFEIQVCPIDVQVCMNNYATQVSVRQSGSAGLHLCCEA